VASRKGTQSLEFAGLMATAILLAFALPGHAHSLGGECRIQGERLQVTSKYSDQTPAAFASVRILDSKYKVIINDKLDSKGYREFARLTPGSYVVILETEGHSKRMSIRVPTQNGYSGIISDGPTLEEFTAFPWAKVLIGLTTIAGLAAAILFARRGRANRV